MSLELLTVLVIGLLIFSAGDAMLDGVRLKQLEKRLDALEKLVKGGGK